MQATFSQSFESDDGSSVFAGPLQMVRIVLSGALGASVVCNGCHTVNRPAALACKACSGKLPAYFARSRSGRPSF